MLLRTNILLDNIRILATANSEATAETTAPSALKNKNVQSISSSSPSSSTSERYQSKAKMRSDSAKMGCINSSLILQDSDQTNHSKVQTQPSNESMYSKALSLISKTITSTKNVQVSINKLQKVFATSTVAPTPPTKFKKTVAMTHLYEQFYHKYYSNIRRAHPTVYCITDAKAFAVYDKGSNIVSRIERMVKDVQTETSDSKVNTKGGHRNKSTSQPKNNADYPDTTNELVLDSKVNHELQVNGAPCFSSTASSSSSTATATATTTTAAAAAAARSVNTKSTPSNKLNSRPKSKKDNINDGAASPSDITTAHYISFNFDNPKLNNFAHQHAFKEKKKVIPSVPVKPQDVESYSEEVEEVEEEVEVDDDCDNNSMYSYFEMIQLLQESPDFYNRGEDEEILIEGEEEEEEEEEKNEADQEENKEIKEHEAPEPVTLENALTELNTGRLNIIDTLAKVNKKIIKLLDNICNNKKRIVTVGFKCEDIAKEENEGNISSERAEELKLKKEEYQKRLENYQNNHEKMKTQAMIHMTKAVGNLVTLVSTERALVSMEREFSIIKKKKNGIFKKIGNFFGFGRKN